MTTTPEALDALILEAVSKHDEIMEELREVNDELATLKTERQETLAKLRRADKEIRRLKYERHRALERSGSKPTGAGERKREVIDDR